MGQCQQHVQLHVNHWYVWVTKGCSKDAERFTRIFIMLYSRILAQIAHEDKLRSSSMNHVIFQINRNYTFDIPVSLIDYQLIHSQYLVGRQ
jgi:hypothetical protein